MKRLSALTAALLSALLIATSSAATNNGDRILGEYRAVKDGRVTTVRFSKSGENRYKAQVVGVRSEKVDNSCKDSHNTEINPKQIVIIESVSYNSEEDVWDDGQIYDPIKGDIYRVVLDFKDETTLRVRGYLGPFSKSLYWEKIN